MTADCQKVLNINPVFIFIFSNFHILVTNYFGYSTDVVESHILADNPSFSFPIKAVLVKLHLQPSQSFMNGCTHGTPWFQELTVCKYRSSSQIGNPELTIIPLELPGSIFESWCIYQHMMLSYLILYFILESCMSISPNQNVNLLTNFSRADQAINVEKQTYSYHPFFLSWGWDGKSYWAALYFSNRKGRRELKKIAKWQCRRAWC